jgi:hypothetical protein
MKAGDKRSNRLAGISECVGNRRELEDSSSVPFCPTGEHTGTEFLSSIYLLFPKYSEI